jgi:hypothetical protein
VSRPLLITDCDEVLLHMVRHFGEWLDEAHGIDFFPEGGAFADALRRQDDGLLVPEREVWPLLDGFFDTQMHRQTLTPGAGEALQRIAEEGDIVILTNLKDWCHAGRSKQLDAHGIRHRIVCNQGGKGPPVAQLAHEHGSSVTVFVDDLEGHHASVATHAPDVFRIHMIAEPRIASTIPPAPHAHVRIDAWDEAVEWVLARFRGEPIA